MEKHFSICSMNFSYFRALLALLQTTGLYTEPLLSNDNISTNLSYVGILRMFLR